MTDIKKHMPLRVRLKHFLYATCIDDSLLEDYVTDTYTCGICGKTYTGQQLKNLGLRPKVLKRGLGRR